MFSTGHPRQYSLAPAMLVCADRTRRGMFIAVWPQITFTVSNANIYPSNSRVEASFRLLTVVLSFRARESPLPSLSPWLGAGSEGLDNDAKGSSRVQLSAGMHTLQFYFRAFRDSRKMFVTRYSKQLWVISHPKNLSGNPSKRCTKEKVKNVCGFFPQVWVSLLLPFPDISPNPKASDVKRLSRAPQSVPGATGVKGRFHCGFALAVRTRKPEPNPKMAFNDQDSLSSRCHLLEQRLTCYLVPSSCPSYKKKGSASMRGTSRLVPDEKSLNKSRIW